MSARLRQSRKQMTHQRADPSRNESELGFEFMGRVRVVSPSRNDDASLDEGASLVKTTELPCNLSSHQVRRDVVGKPRTNHLVSVECGFQPAERPQLHGTGVPHKRI